MPAGISVDSLSQDDHIEIVEILSGQTLTAACPKAWAIGTDALVLDASVRQALAATRSLGRAGLRVGTAESPDVPNSSSRLPVFESRWSSWNALLPTYYSEPDLYARSVLGLAARQRIPVVIPSTDGSIAALRPWRERFEANGVTLAIAGEPALSIANDKRRTLDLAVGLGIRVPHTLPAESTEDVISALSEIGYPAVIKPTTSWVTDTSKSVRASASLVVDEAEAVACSDGLFSLGSRAVVQQWVSGRRDAVNLLYADGRVRAAIAQVAYRTAPVLGGVSVVRETIPMPDDLLVPAISLVEALNLEGYSEVEFRRDSAGRPLVMEINARLTAGIELAIRAGVDFPIMAWRWARQDSIPTSSGYRSGVRMRFLSGDLEWLWENFKHRARPDAVSPLAASRIFARDFLRRQAYDYVDRTDPIPAAVAIALHLGQVGRRVKGKYAGNKVQSCKSDVHILEGQRV